MYYCGHNLMVDGGITLQNGFLYVDGNLTVTNGGIKGVGAIVVDGDVLVHDESFSASHRVALLTSGDVNLEGNGNYLQGLVYAGGSLSAKKLTVLGNVVVNNPDPTKGSSTLDQVRIVSNPETASFSFTVPSSQVGAGNPALVHYMNAEATASGSPGSTSTQGVPYTFDVNAFLPLGEGMKVVLWHVHHVPP